MGLLKKKKDFTIPKTGIDSVEKVSLGGVDQSILIQAENPAHPVLLFLHGGPCMSVPGVASRGQDYAIATTTKELVKNFVVVFWDQRGAGKSFNKSISPESMRIEQYISDCNELIDILKNRFNQEKIYLTGHSWGTVIGLEITIRYPEKLYAYVGISQVMNWAENDKFCYEWLLREAKNKNDKKTLRKLEKLGMPPYVNDVKHWIAFRSPLMKYKSMVYESETVKHPGMMEAFKIFLNAPNYSLLDIYHTFRSAYNLTYTKELIGDFAKIDFHSINNIDVPVFFLHGRQDMHLDGEPVQTFFEKVAASDKQMVWYENSSHMFHPNDAREIEKYLIEVVKEQK